MPYLDEAGLAHYDPKLKEWISSQPVKTLPSSLYPWTQTDKAGSVTCWPVGGTQLLPTVDFLFTETPPANGDKSPSNPSTITGVSSVKVTRCGKNVCSTKNLYTTTPNLFALDTITGGIKISGTTGSSATNIELRSVSNSQNALDGGMLQRGKTYTFSHSGNAPANNYPYFRLYVKETASSGWGSAKVSLANGGSATYSVPSTAYACMVRIDLGYNTTYNCECFVQIEEGSTATTFEQYSGDTYTIPLNSTYYGGSIDLSTGLMTVTWHGVKLTSSSGFRGPFDIAQSGSNKRYIANLPYGAAPYTATNQACSHYNYSHSFDANTQQAWVASGGACYIYDSFTTVAELNAFLDSQNSNGTPVVICYQLATPITVQLTPPQILALAQPDKYVPRLNTVYTDADAVQVGYVKSPIREEYELVQAIVAQGGEI